MAKTLKEKTAHAIAWNFVDKFGQQGLNLIVGIILARYFLSPSEYGLIGMIAIFNALGYILIDSGFSNALIRKQDITQTDLSSVFYFNIVISLVFYTGLFFCAPFIALFYNQPILTALIRVMSLGIPLSSLALIQVTLLSKSINFKLLARTNLIALFCSGTLSLFLAWKGFGVWVLVIQPLSNTIVRNICLWSASSWRPRAIYSKQSIKELWGYSSKLLVSSVLSIIFNNIYISLIGKFYLMRDAGYYTQANKYAELPFTTVGQSIQTAVYPIISPMANDTERLRNAFRKIIRVTAFVCCPVFFGVAAIAQPLIGTLIGSKWLPIVPYMQVLCIGYLFYTLAVLNANILYTKGKSTQVLYLNICRTLLHVICIVSTLKMGVFALVCGWSVVSVLFALLLFICAGKQIKYSLYCQCKDILPYFVLAAVMAAGLYILPFHITNEFILLATQILVGVVFYLGAVYLFGSKVFRETLDILKINRTKNNE